MPDTFVHLTPEQFSRREERLVESGSLSASAFRFPSGVAGLRLRNELGELVILPFQGQQIWSASFHGRDLTMVSMFDEPWPTREYLQTYGGFLLHCGATAMGVPGPGDDHPLHGELPNAPYGEAHLVVGEDDGGRYLGLGGSYRHTVAFSTNYLAEPLVKLREDSSLIDVSFRLTNLKRTEMDLMYLAHVNFRPVNGGRLLYSAVTDPRHVRVRRSIPSHVRPAPSYLKFLEDLSRNPEHHHLLEPGLAFDPEVAFFIDYLADRWGWAHSLQVHPDGSADYVAHRPDELDKATRWICRTPDQDAVGIVLPGTAEPEGYGAEKAKGNIKVLPPGGIFSCQLTIGSLLSGEAREVRERIEGIISNSTEA